MIDDISSIGQQNPLSTVGALNLNMLILIFLGKSEICKNPGVNVKPSVLKLARVFTRSGSLLLSDQYKRMLDLGRQS